MAVYKIPQDVEADDKFVGPLSFKQFIFIGIAVVCAYLSFLSATKGLWPALIFFAPIIIGTGFLGFPWGRDQPTEIWLAARIRFLIKPRVRVWNQTGIKELVTVTAPKKIDKVYTNGLSQNDVNSRLSGLATLLDSRGWAVKNMNNSIYTSPIANQAGSNDRLIDVSSMPKQVTETFSSAADVLDESSNATALNFDQMIKNSEQKHREEIMNQLQSARQPEPVATPQQQPADFWFLQNQAGNAAQSSPAFVPPTAAPVVGFAPTVISPLTPAVQQPFVQPQQPQAPVNDMSEAALLERLHRQQAQSAVQHSHLKTILPLSEQQALAKQQQVVAAQAAQAAAMQPPTNYAYKPPKPVTPPVNPAIMNLANNDDLNIATLARQASKKQDTSGDGEVVISLH